MFALKIVKSICEISAKATFDFWSDNNFREQIKFGSISKTEQDRIFNELLVSHLGLLNLKLTFLLQEAKNKQVKSFYEDLQNNLQEGFLEIFQDLNTPEPFLKQWRILINIRFEEFQKDYQMLFEEGKNMKEMQDDPDFLPTWARIETITLDSLQHIRKGNLNDKDPLLRMIRKWLTMMEVTFTKILKIQTENQKPIKS